MSDPTRIRALEEFGRQLDGVIPQRPRRLQGRRGVVAAVVAIGVVAAPAVAATTGGFDFGPNTPRPGQPGGPPKVVDDPAATALEVISILQRPGGEQELRARLKPYGIRVRVEGRPVAPAAVGRIFGVQFPRKARFDAQHRLVLERGVGGTILVTVGRPPKPGEPAGTAGLSLFEVLPQVESAVRRDDPVGTLERLRGLGFRVAIKLVIDNPDRGAVAATGVKDVASPPKGTVVLSILNARGGSAATPQTRSLIMEVAPVGAKVARDHP